MTDRESPDAPEAIAEEEEWSDATSTWLQSQNPALGDQEIVSVYEKGETRLVTQPVDFLIRDLRQRLAEEQFVNLAPEYQRRICWDDPKRSRLIESLLMNVPVPPVFLYEVDFASYEVMDGQQRLDTIRRYFANQFALCGLAEWACLNGRSYEDLPPAIQRGLLRRSIGAVIVLRESAKPTDTAWELRRNVFERLNTGATPLNKQEIRNALFYGPFAKLLEVLARTKEFSQAWDLPTDQAELADNSLYQRMIDSEIVLRYFALRGEPDIAGSMRKTLDECMRRHQGDSASELARLKSDYMLALRTARAIYGADCFRLLPSATGRRGQLSKPLYDAVMVGLHRHIHARGGTPRERAARLARAGAELMAQTQAYLGNRRRYEILVARANTRKATLARIKLMEKLFRTYGGAG